MGDGEEASKVDDTHKEYGDYQYVLAILNHITLNHMEIN